MAKVIVYSASVDTSPANDAKAAAPPAVAGDCAAEAVAGLATLILTEPRTGLLTDALCAELWQKAGVGPAELSEAEFAEALEAIGTKHNFGLEPGRQAGTKERESFWRALHIEDLVLALGCALGREAAWQRFMTEYRGQLTRAAVGLTRSSVLGEELVDALYAELFGLRGHDGVRRSPLERYSGRGSLMGWLRAMLAQRQVDHYRRTYRETALDDVEPVAPEAARPETLALGHLLEALRMALKGLAAEERFLLSAYYLDGHTLLELSRVLAVHEATISRKLKRATGHVRKDLLRALQAGGLSRRAAEEALGVDPRDVDLNLRKLLQIPGDRTYSDKEGRV